MMISKFSLIKKKLDIKKTYSVFFVHNRMSEDTLKSLARPAYHYFRRRHSIKYLEQQKIKKEKKIYAFDIVLYIIIITSFIPPFFRQTMTSSMSFSISSTYEFRQWTACKVSSRKRFRIWFTLLLARFIVFGFRSSVGTGCLLSGRISNKVCSISIFRF